MLRRMTGRITIGIDAGGSGCRVALRLPSGQVTSAKGGPANAFADPAKAADEIRACLNRAVAKAGLGADMLSGAAICAGVAGCRLPAIAEDMTARLASPVRVVDDSVTALHGTFPDRDGCLVNLGTGSFFLRKTGEEYRHIGGWGFDLGDEASGAWAGRLAAGACLRVLDGRLPEDPLADAVLAQLSPHPLIALQGASPAAFAALAPLVLKNAASPLGASILAACLDEVAHGLAALGWSRGVLWALTGGFGTALIPHLPPALRAGLTEPQGTALDGALALAEAMP